MGRLLFKRPPCYVHGSVEWLPRGIILRTQYGMAQWFEVRLQQHGAVVLEDAVLGTLYLRT